MSSITQYFIFSSENIIWLRYIYITWTVSRGQGHVGTSALELRNTGSYRLWRQSVDIWNRIQATTGCAASAVNRK